MTNQTSPKSFIIHKDSLSILNKLSKEQAGELFFAIYEYQMTKKTPTENLISIIFEPFLNQFIRDEEKWQKVREARIGAGSMGGKQKVANASKCKQNLANLAVSVSKNVNVSVNASKNTSGNSKELLLKNDFAEFWQFYTPTKTKDGESAKGSKKVALQKYEIVRRKHSHQQIMQKLEKYLRNCQANGRFTKMAETWLNQEDFDDNSDEVYIETTKRPTSASDARQQANESSSEKFLNSDAISIFSDKFQL